MSASAMGRLGMEGLWIPLRGVDGFKPADPPFEPGSVYVERAPDGSLDTLHVSPVAGARPQADGAPRVDWSRLFGEARLDMSAFTPSAPEPALSLPGRLRTAWAGSAPGTGSPLRVEAAELAGRPVAFRVLSPRTPFEFGSTAVIDPDDTSSAGTVSVVAIVGFLTLSWAGVGFFMHRNLTLGRGDRRGAGRLARAMAALVFLASLLTSSAPFDSRIFGTLHGAAAAGLFAGAWCWAYYMAIEPFVRRQWPRMLVGWSRLMGGEWGDPQVGREILIGTLSALAIASLFVPVTALAVRDGREFPLAEEFYFRALGSTRELTGGVFQLLPWAVFVSLMWMVLLLMLRRVLRHDLAAIGVLSVLTVGLVPPSQWIFALVMLAGNLVSLYMALRVGFLALVAGATVGLALSSLPVSPGTPGFVGSLSWLTVAVIAVPALFGLYTSLAGQSIFGRSAD